MAVERVTEMVMDRAAAVIVRGGLVAMPTETVYGLAADAMQPEAVARIFEVKGRPRFDPLIVHVADVEQARSVTGSWPEAAEVLAAKFWPGPLTLVLPKAWQVPELVTSGLSTVAVRVPSHPAALDLIRLSGRALAAPSANRFGHVSPTTAGHVWDDLRDQVDVILDAGPTSAGIESTIVWLHESGEVELLRPGAVSRAELEEVLGRSVVLHRVRAEDEEHPEAPGMLSRHYSPGVLMVWGGANSGEVICAPEPGRWGLLTVGPVVGEGFAAVRVLSERGDLREAAAGLFSGMRELESADLDGIVAVPGEPAGLGEAINDRLRRACWR